MDANQEEDNRNSHNSSSAALAAQQQHQTTMAPKKITVLDASGGESKLALSNDEEFRDSIKNERGVRCLINVDGYEISGFESLEHGGTYTLGPTIQQQHHKVSPDCNQPRLERLIRVYTLAMVPCYWFDCSTTANACWCPS